MPPEGAIHYITLSTVVRRQRGMKFRLYFPVGRIMVLEPSAASVVISHLR